MTSSSPIRAKLGVASRLSKYADHHDDFPTPPWATRAFLEYVAPELILNSRHLTVLDPACGRGHIIQVLKQLKFRTLAYDNWRYNKEHKLADYLNEVTYPSYDLMITNPPYKYANEFARRAINEAKRGVALLVRTMWLEGAARYRHLFGPTPPTRVAVFSKRMQSTHGRLVQHGQAMMSHSWFWWDLRDKLKRTELIWLPPDAQNRLERKEDYK